jgi:hypothetical protein
MYSSADVMNFTTNPLRSTSRRVKSRVLSELLVKTTTSCAFNLDLVTAVCSFKVFAKVAAAPRVYPEPPLGCRGILALFLPQYFLECAHASVCPCPCVRQKSFQTVLVELVVPVSIAELPTAYSCNGYRVPPC